MLHFYLEPGIIIYSCMVFYADTFSHNWGNAVFAGFNAIVTFWALTAYIGSGIPCKTWCSV